MICKQCLKDLPSTDFYIMAGKPSGRCKECTRRDRQMSKLYHEHALTPYNEWPEPLRDFAEEMKKLSDRGAKIDYAQSEIPSMIERLSVSLSDEDMALLSLEAICEMLSSIRQRVEALEDALIATNWLPTEHRVDEEAEAQRRSNLIKALSKDQYLEEILGPEEHTQVVDTLLEAHQAYRSTGIIPGTVLRRLCAPFQEYQCRMPPDMLVFYESFLKPGIEATKASDSYAQHAESVEELLGLNFYDLDWAGIPYYE